MQITQQAKKQWDKCLQQVGKNDTIGMIYMFIVNFNQV